MDLHLRRTDMHALPGVARKGVCRSVHLDFDRFPFLSLPVEDAPGGRRPSEIKIFLSLNFRPAILENRGKQSVHHLTLAHSAHVKTPLSRYFYDSEPWRHGSNCENRWFSAANYLNRARAPPPSSPLDSCVVGRAANSPGRRPGLPAC